MIRLMPCFCFLLVTVPAYTGQAQVVEEDSLALVALYRATDGTHWITNTNWLTGPVDTWHGVTTSDGRVTHLELAANGLKRDFDSEISDGVLPSAIGDLLHLQVLNLQSNQLQGAVPVEITNLTHLEHLYLNDNFLRDLPDLTGIGTNSTAGAPTLLSVENNILTFEDLEPNIGLAATFTYAPQAQTPRPDGSTGFEGESIVLQTSVGGEHNRYQWYKDDIALVGATSNTYTIAAMMLSDEGIYEVEITNSVVPNLALRSLPFYLWFDKRFTGQWLDIGAYHHVYAESGARHESALMPEGMEYPAILRHSGHIRAKGFWIGVKDWTDPQGQHYPYYVARIGPRSSGAKITFPIQNKLIGRYEDTIVEVDGVPSFDNAAVLDEINPNLTADRMLHNIHNMAVGITVERKIYAYTNPYHDNYHLIEYIYCNTGNTDGDEEIELPNQSLHDVIFFRSHRWRGSEQGARATSAAQTWGRYTVHDVVGDGHEEYPVDFTAQYAWIGRSIESSGRDYSDLGGPLFSDDDETVAPGDSIGRLSAATMVGRSTIHADRSTTDASYDRNQPTFMAWMSNDDPLASDGSSHEDYYEHGIVSPDLIDENSDCTDCTRAYPHFAERNQPDGEFWNPSSSREGLLLTGRIAGGYSPTTGYGPYEMAPGECVNITVSEGIAGLSFDATTKIGQAFKGAGRDRDTQIIEYDANGDGAINATPFDYNRVFVGTEAQTKDQWVMTARDSLFQMFYRARDLYSASQHMTTYPVAEPSRAPTRFSLWSRADRIDLEWTPAPDGPAVVQWQLYRTEGRVDNLYVNGCLEDLSLECGYEHVATLPGETTAYTDTTVAVGTGYYYYLEGVGQPQPDDPRAISGTPGGVPLRSGRYLTQTYTPVTLQTGTGIEEAGVPMEFELEGNYPNPFSGRTTIRYSLPAATEVEMLIYDVQGRLVEVLVRGYRAAGRHEQVFDATALPSGMYVYILRTGKHQALNKMLVIQ